jgi:hypothetical protein
MEKALTAYIEINLTLNERKHSNNNNDNNNNNNVLVEGEPPIIISNKMLKNKLKVNNILETKFKLKPKRWNLKEKLRITTRREDINTRKLYKNGYFRKENKDYRERRIALFGRPQEHSREEEYNYDKIKRKMRRTDTYKVIERFEQETIIINIPEPRTRNVRNPGEGCKALIKSGPFKNQRCDKAKKETTEYCGYHKKLAEKERETNINNNNNNNNNNNYQCQALTNLNKRCSRNKNINNNNNLCSQHNKMYENNPTNVTIIIE